MPARFNNLSQKSKLPRKLTSNTKLLLSPLLLKKLTVFRLRRAMVFGDLVGSHPTIGAALAKNSNQMTNFIMRTFWSSIAVCSMHLKLL